MSPAATRSTARRRANAKLPAKSRHADGDPSSSEEDDEGIPAHPSARKYQRGPHGPTLRPTNMKRLRQEGPSRQAAASKRQKTNELVRKPSGASAPSASGHENDYTNPTSSRIAHEAVDEELVSLLNKTCGPEVTLDLPSQQLRAELSQAAAEHEKAVYESDIGDQDEVDADSGSQELEPEDIDLSVAPVGHRAKAYYQRDKVRGSDPQPDVYHGKPNDTLSHNAEDVRDACDATAEQGGDERPIPSVAPHHDVYAFRASPQINPAARRISAPTVSNSGRLRTQNPKPHKSKKRYTRTQEQEIRGRNHNQRKHKGVDTEEQGGEGGEPVLPEFPRQSQRHAESTAVDHNNDPAEDSEDDLEFSSDMDADDGNNEATFAQDVQKFGANPDKHGDGSLVFGAPAGDNHITITLLRKEYQKASTLMSRLAWAGIRYDWETKLMEKHEPRTTTGRYLALYLQKLERFIVETPQAPQVAEQNRFLRQHREFLEYSFRKIDRGIGNVISKKLSVTSRSGSPDHIEKRKDMSWDLVRLVIPLFIRVLGKAWALGGDKASFTIVTVQPLVKLVDWTAKIYAALCSELKQRPLEKKPNPEAETRKAQWQKIIDHRNELGSHLAKLHDMLEQAPSNLKKEERRQAREKVDRQRKLERQAEIAIELELKAVAKQEAQKAQNILVVRAIRGAAPKREARSTPNRRVARPPGEVAAQTPISSSASTAYLQAPSPLWREEEEEYLCKELQSAFEHEPPQLPDLATTATVIGHSRQETKDKARDLLSLMLSTAYPDMTGREIQSEIQKLMRQWS